MDTEITAIIGLDENNNPVSRYKDAKGFEATHDPEDPNIICYGLYIRKGNGEAQHVADFCHEEDAQAMEDILHLADDVNAICGHILMGRSEGFDIKELKQQAQQALNKALKNNTT